MPNDRPKKLDLGAFIALMSEMGVEVVALPEGEPEHRDQKRHKTEEDAAEQA
jgi:hypothetical protein